MLYISNAQITLLSVKTMMYIPPQPFFLSIQSFSSFLVTIFLLSAVTWETWLFILQSFLKFTLLCCQKINISFLLSWYLPSSLSQSNSSHSLSLSAVLFFLWKKSLYSLIFKLYEPCFCVEANLLESVSFCKPLSLIWALCFLINFIVAVLCFFAPTTFL